jgi:hypothetical protein
MARQTALAIARREISLQLSVLLLLNDIESIGPKRGDRFTAKEQKDKKSYWDSELNSLGIDPKHKNDLNDNDELAALADNISKPIIKSAYNESIDPDDPKFDSILSTCGAISISHIESKLSYIFMNANVLSHDLRAVWQEVLFA